MYRGNLHLENDAYIEITDTNFVSNFQFPKKTNHVFKVLLYTVPAY